jgi:pyruvate carboxylase subunit A
MALGRIRKLLVANRGEVAVRIMRACAELGIRSVAIFSDADRHALHVKKADEAYSVGEDPLGGYLNAPGIVDLALASGCQALHPGYGFLAENPALAELCRRRGLIFVGPSPEVIRRMGDKTEARKTVAAAGVPVVPGSEGNLGSADEAVGLAESIGYPVMLKATSGGGGRGIRRCRDRAELRSNYERVVSESTKAFGSAEIFLEKYIPSPRHIEVQVLGDGFGNLIHLFERDCSIQRRHQKLVEVAPSPQLTGAQRQCLYDLALRAARAADYQNAGTVEFLLDGAGQVYFLEMNTRLQVEHTVTEQITGIDIVQEQIRIAAGETLSVRQPEVERRGYAIQFRVNAEDPKQGFLPSFGKITRYYSPGGPGVRTDGQIYTGYELPRHYDSLCVKLTVWARTWEQCLARARRGLQDMGLYGIRHTVPFYLQLLDTPEFARGEFDTGFVELHPELTQYSDERPLAHVVAVVAAAIARHRGLAGPEVSGRP